MTIPHEENVVTIDKKYISRNKIRMYVCMYVCMYINLYLNTENHQLSLS